MSFYCPPKYSYTNSKVYLPGATTQTAITPVYVTVETTILPSDLPNHAIYRHQIYIRKPRIIGFRDGEQMIIVALEHVSHPRLQCTFNYRKLWKWPRYNTQLILE
jgi:hypothetical protein